MSPAQHSLETVVSPPPPTYAPQPGPIKLHGNTRATRVDDDDDDDDDDDTDAVVATDDEDDSALLLSE